MDAHTPPVTASAPETLTFPAGFRWGVATSSYQFEGNCANSQWYAWERAGHSKSGDVATQERTLHPSGQFYGAIASANALPPLWCANL